MALIIFNVIKNFNNTKNFNKHEILEYSTSRRGTSLSKWWIPPHHSKTQFMKRLQLSLVEFEDFKSKASFMYGWTVSGSYVNIDAEEGDLKAMGYTDLELSNVGDD